MGLWSLLGFRRRRAVDPALDALAATICANLRGLGLSAQARPHGRGFVEIRASTSPHLITTPGDPEASGVALLLAGAFEPPALVFEQINSRHRGLGRRMVDAVMQGLRLHRGVLSEAKVNDLSPVQPDGRRWWAHVAEDYPDIAWRLTNDPDATHWIARSPDFIARAEALARLARDFGHDPALVTLSPERKVFRYLGQDFPSEGEASPDGRVTIYYDPETTLARLGCCLAHELQHVRYFAVRAAYEAEAPDGPLHRRFSAFTPQRLAALRGVSAYSNEHWDAWRGTSPPRLFSDELAEGGSEPVNETIAEVAKALYNWGPAAKLPPQWVELKVAIDEEYARLGGSEGAGG
jgi:hypothetical protein